jgi:hypothetical protein
MHLKLWKVYWLWIRMLDSDEASNARSRVVNTSLLLLECPKT